MTGRSPKRTCAQPEKIRVIPENEIPPAMRVEIYFQKNHYAQTYFVLDFVVKICYNKIKIIKRSQTNEKQRNYRIGSGNTYQ